MGIPQNTRRLARVPLARQRPTSLYPATLLYAMTMLAIFKPPRRSLVLALAIKRMLVETSATHIVGSNVSQRARRESRHWCIPQCLSEIKVQIIHHHDDRTPITPLIDKAFWASTLVKEATLARFSSKTHLVQDAQPNTHYGGGRGPVGKLTEIGLQQLVEVDQRLRSELVTDQLDQEIVHDNTGHRHYPHVWHPRRPFTPSDIRVSSTDFSPTI